MCIDINDEVNKFKASINKGFKEKMDKEINEDVVEEAMYSGYLDTCRTINLKKISKENKNQKELIKGIFKKKENVPFKIVEVLTGKINSQELFDNKHKELCEDLKNNFKESEIKIFDGQAQKIINMTFKYLYCIESINKERFRNCHMPLDSFTLEWIYRACIFEKNLKPKFEEGAVVGDVWKKEGKVKKGAMGSWSSMGYSKKSDDKKCTYLFYLTLLSWEKELYLGKLSLLEFDFYIWPRMQKIIAAEEFIKAFNEDDNEIKCEDYKLENLECTLQNKLKKVREIICSK